MPARFAVDVPPERRRQTPNWSHGLAGIGTAGVGEVFLDAWQLRGVDGDRACWRFTEHRNEDPLRAPAVPRRDTWWNLA